ncbi:RDD family protein [Cutibacterium sp. V947]|uniref:RDD family protein n=1 Tax=Cutibacterium sp. V947 TaxID=3446480 RepID=UPI003EE2A902
MSTQALILTIIAVVIALVLLVPTLVHKVRKEGRRPTGSPEPVTKQRRFGTLAIDAVWVVVLSMLARGLYFGSALAYEANTIDQKPAIEQAIQAVGTDLLIGVNIGYVLVCLLGRLGVSPGTSSRNLAWVNENGRPAGRGHTLVIGLAFILAILGKTVVGGFASIGILILFVEAISVLWDERGIIAKLMHLQLVDSRTLSSSQHLH